MAIPQVTGFQTNDFVRPSDEIDPKLKNERPDYSLDYAKFIYSQYMRGNTFIKQDDIEKIARARAYAAGKQDSSTYKDRFLHEVGGNKSEPNIPVVNRDSGEVSNKHKREGYVDMNFDDIFSPLPKYVQNIIGIMEGQEHDVAVDAIDERSGSTKEEMKYTFFVKEKLSETIKKFDKVFEIPSLEEEMPTPSSLRELNMLSKMGQFKLPYEIGMKKAIRDSEDLSKLGKIKRYVVRDLITIGKSLVWSYIDPVTNRVKHKYVDPINSIIEDTQEEDGSDVTYWGFIEYVSVADIRAATGWSEDKVKEMVEQWAGRLDNPEMSQLKDTSPGTYGYDTFKIPVLDCYWVANDHKYTTTRKLKNGKEVEYPEKYRNGGTKPPRMRNNDKRKTEKTTIRTLYTAKWVIGSEEAIYDYGKAVDIPYDYSMRDVYPAVHLFRIGVKPIIENMIAIEDQIMFSFLRFQNAIIKAPPPGLAIQVSSLRNLKVGKSKWDPLDTIRFYSHTGNLLYELTPTQLDSLPGTGHNAGKPFEELKGGMGTAISEAVTTLELLYRQLDILSGIDPITSVSKSPTADQGKAVTEMAVAATSNTLKPIYSGWLSIRESMSRAAALMVQSIFSGYNKEDVGKCPYTKIIGLQHALAIMSAMDYPPCDYGFRLVAKPNEKIKEEIRASAQLALSKGHLSNGDYLFLMSVIDTDDGIKYARMYIAFHEAQAIERESKQQLKHAEAQNKGQREAKELEAKITQDKISAEAKAKLDEIRAKGEEDRKTLDHEYALKSRYEQPMSENST